MDKCMFASFVAVIGVMAFGIAAFLVQFPIVATAVAGSLLVPRRWQD